MVKFQIKQDDWLYSTSKFLIKYSAYNQVNDNGTIQFKKKIT